MAKKLEFTTKEDIIRLIKVWPDCSSNKEVAERIGKSMEWVGRIVPLVRNAGYDLPKKYKRETLSKLIEEALTEVR